MPTIRVPNFNIPKINVQRESSINNGFGTGREDNTIETPKDINSNDPFETAAQNNDAIQLPKQKTTKVNEDLPVFATGNELLVETDD